MPNVSEIGVQLTASPPVTPHASSGTPLSIVRTAALAGVTLFDLTELASPDWGEAALGAALGTGGPYWAVVRIGPHRPGAARFSPLDPDRLRRELRGAVDGIQRRLGGVVRPFGQLFEPSAEELEIAVPELETFVEQGPLVGWGIRGAGSRTVLERLPELARRGCLSLGVEANLLDHAGAWALAGRLPGPEMSLLVYDPFAAGRLDGSFLEPNAESPAPGGSAPTWEDVRARMAPVLRLGFLTRDGRRTLPDAALKFLLRPKFVGAVVVPLSGPVRQRERFDLDRVPDLTDDEIAELESLAAPSA